MFGRRAATRGRRRGAARPATLLLGISATLPFVGAAFAPQSKPAAPPDFAREVLPILKAHCSSCHAAKSPMAGLVLTTPEGVLKGGVSGKAVVPGNSGKSLLVRRLLGLDDKPRMPMGFKPLPEAKIRLIRAWIDAGAKVKAGKPPVHWAYAAPVRPEPPRVEHSDWVRNPIDRFVLDRLKREGMMPSPEASRETLIRRLSLDLVGLPPTLEEIDAFLEDQSPDAYERAVDRLLASPHYGERQARVWLDLSRYADSDGYEKDLNRVAWKYRDWLIEAFNKNYPYDRFIVEQMAGDLLPNRTLDQWIATGFHRNSMLNLEGGVDQAEATFEVTIDRLGTTGSVFLGSTIQCARCHDHKYDPFSQKDFYRMLAFFSNPVVIPQGDAKVGEEKWIEPIIDAPTKWQAAKRGDLRMEVAGLERRLRSRTPEVVAAQADWETWAKEPAEWTALQAKSAESQSGAELRAMADGQIRAFGKVPDKDTYRLKFPLPERAITGIRLEALADPDLPNRGPGRASNGNFVIAKIELKVDGKPVAVRLARASHEQQGFPIANAFDEDGNSGWAVSPKFGTTHEAVLELAEPIPESARELEVVLDQTSGFLKHLLGRFRISVTGSAGPAMRLHPTDISELIAKNRRTEAEQAKVDAYYASIAPSLEPVRKEIAAARKRLAELERQIPKALVLKDKPAKGPLATNVHIRGEFLNVGEKVLGGTPGFLPPMPSGVPINRLGFAKWIVSPENPLTARVQVNRMWAQYFGRGIVETEEDFGTQCSPPTHPQLLDWLATELIRQNWDLKAIHRLIVTSATYRQSSDATSELLERDPENALLARGPRFRMEAEAIRDNALAAAGLLSRKIGGPSAYPHQPDGVWNIPFAGETWMTSKGENLYRRGIYTFWKRTAPYPAFTNFDATSRESCTVRRIRTNTPLQALTLLNDPAFLEAAKGLANRMLADPDMDTLARIELGFRLCTGRRPSVAEAQRLASLAASLRNAYEKDPKHAERLAGSAESAVWTMIGSVLLNLDETITKS